MKYTLGKWQIDSNTRNATRGDQVERLSPRAVNLALELAQAGGAAVSRAELLDRVWPDVFVSDESLSQVVTELRRKLGRSMIETIPRMGYRLSVPAMQVVDSTPISSSETEGIDLDAYALCLEARAEMVRCGRGSLERADELTEEAVSLAPYCGRIHSERAFALVRRHAYWSEGQHLLDQAIEHARQALTLSPDSALAHSAMGYAATLAGQWRVAERAHCAALERSPHDPIILHNAAWYLMSRGRIGAATAYFEQVGDLEPQNIKGYLMAAHLTALSDTARSRRNSERALQRTQTRLAVDPGDPRALSAPAVLMVLFGETLAGSAAMEQVDVQESSQAIYHAAAWARLGELERARYLLEDLFDHGWRDTYWLDAEPGFTALRADRRFQRMRQSLAAA
ncbi:MAG: winged helix-turn-helix domain-containing protein [Pseudomonadota bacterium]